MGFWTALSALAPIAPAQADAQEIRRQRALQDQEARQQGQLRQVQTQEAQQRIRAGNQAVPRGEPFMRDGKMVQAVLDPVKGLTVQDAPWAQSSQQENQQRLDMLRQNRKALDDDPTFKNRPDEVKDYLAELMSGLKPQAPRAERIKIGDVLKVDPSISPTGWAREVLDLDTGQHLRWQVSEPTRYMMPSETNTSTYNPQYGMNVNSTSIRKPLLGPAVGGAGQKALTGAVTPQVLPGATAPRASVPTGPMANPTANPRATVAAMAAPTGGQAPPILRFPAMNADIRSKADSMTSLQQQFIGTGNDPLWGYADMLDKPALRQAINKALTMSTMPIAEPKEDSGLFSNIGRATGITQALVGKGQERDNAAITQARNEVQRLGGQRAIDFVDRLAELKGSIPTFRKITGASASQGSIAPLIQESPVLNSSNSYDFRKRTAYSLRTMASALRSDPSINPAYAQWLFKMADSAEPPIRLMVGKEPYDVPANEVEAFRKEFPNATQ